MVRPLNKLAAMALADWGPPGPRPRPLYQVFSMPYAQAMLSLSKVSDRYGMDDGEDIVLRFLCNAAQWKGSIAKIVKDELHTHIAEYRHDRHQRAQR